jgi:hypothetical protein
MSPLLGDVGADPGAMFNGAVLVVEAGSPSGPLSKPPAAGKAHMKAVFHVAAGGI